MAEDESGEVPKLPPDARLESLDERLDQLQEAEAKRTQDRFVDFQSQYTFDSLSNVVTMTREGATHFDSDVCTPQDFAQMRPAIEAIGRDVRAEVIVRSTLVESSSVAAQAP